ncbi:unnamed protein product [Closterium sp. NIES-64]|nr:unnamed protein product [Closterium sp. NIES-64]
MPPAGAAAAAAAAAKGAPTSVQPLPVAAINGGAGSGAGGASGTGSGAAGGTALGVAGAGNAVKAPMMVFTPREDVALEDLERILPPLGFGSGGRVYRVRHKKTGKEYALKVIQEKYDEEVRKQIIQEMQILRRARSDHVVECYGIFDHLGEISFVLELMDGGTLADVTKKRGKIPESFMPEVTRQCLQGLLYLHRQHVVHRDIKPSNLLFNRQGQGLLYLHRQHVVHRDIKPSNLLFNRQGQVKIADFGVSKELASTLAQCNSYVGTSAYLSPERTNPPPGEGYDGYLSDVKIADFGVSKELASTLAQCNSYVDTSAYLSPERINPPPGEGYNGYLSDVWSMGLSLLELSSLLSLLLFVIDPFSSASVIPPPLSQVKIADFGVSKELASTLAQCNSYVGTSAYLSPERINPPPGEGYDGYLSDVWSMGLSLLELVIGRFPYVQAGQSADWMTLFGAIVFNEPPEAPGSCSPEFQDFIRCCLQKEPKKRKSAAELLEHPFCQLLPVQMQGAVGPMGQLGGQQMSQQTSQQMSFQMGQQQGMGVMQGFAQGQMQASIQSQPQPQVQMQGMGQYQQQQQPTVGGQVAGQQQQYSVQPGVKHYQPNPQMLQQLTAAQQALPTQKQEKVKRKYDEVVIDARKAAVGPGEEDLSVVAAQSTRQSRGRQAQRRDSPDRTAENDGQADVVDVPSYEGMDARQKKLFEIRLKLNQARKANQTAVVAEKRREEKPEEEESRGVSKAAWFEEKKRKMSKQLDAAGLDITKAYMLETQEAAESKYKKWEKKEAPFGWDAFNQQALYNAYEKRTGNIPYTEEDYLKAKEKDPDFYRDDASLQYGQAPEIPEENVDRMVAELTDRAKSRKEFSRRRRHHDEKDIDSINDRNEHFNRKIERAFGKYTVEIKNNLERGTALPD